MVRRRLVDLNASLAGFTLVISLARSRVSIAPFSEGRAPPGPFGSCDLVFIVEEQGYHEEAGRCTATNKGKRCWEIIQYNERLPQDVSITGSDGWFARRISKTIALLCGSVVLWRPIATATYPVATDRPQLHRSSAKSILCRCGSVRRGSCEVVFSAGGLFGRMHQARIETKK